MSSVMSSLMPSLVLPQRLTPVKKLRKRCRRRRVMPKRVRAADEETKATTPEQGTATPKSQGNPQVNGAPPTSPSSTTPTSPPKASMVATVGERLLKAMKFRGGAPELINGRCAMVAIPSVIAYEMMQKEQFLQLIADHKYLFGGVILVIAIASLVPFARGAKTEPLGFMTPDAELINGRAAMIGILAILILEAKSGTNFF